MAVAGGGGSGSSSCCFTTDMKFQYHMCYLEINRQ